MPISYCAVGRVREEKDTREKKIFTHMGNIHAKDNTGLGGLFWEGKGLKGATVHLEQGGGGSIAWLG